MKLSEILLQEKKQSVGQKWANDKGPFIKGPEWHDLKIMTEKEVFNPSDKITLDIPLFIRVLEYAKEDAKTDMDLHHLAEKAIELSSEYGEILTMDDYDSLIPLQDGKE